MEAHHLDPTTGEDEFALETANAGGNGSGAAKPRPRAQGRRCAVNPADPSTWGKVQRNALCPCGSGKKYKHCHGTLRLGHQSLASCPGDFGRAALLDRRPPVWLPPARTRSGLCRR